MSINRKDNIKYIRKLIKLLGDGIDEIIIDIELYSNTYNSIELFEEGFILNQWFDHDMEFGMNHNDLCDDDIDYIREELENLI